MKTFWFQIIGLTTLICLAAFLVFNQTYLTALISPFLKDSITNRVNTPVANSVPNSILKIVGSDGTEKATLNIEVANTKEKRNKGLGYRESLASDSGMLFIHDNSQKYTYWMKGMQFPIDIMWVSENTIMDYVQSAMPPVENQADDTLVRYSSPVDVNKVLETNAGFITKNNIQKGDKIIVE